MLQHAAANGPVIVLNPSKTGCAVLVLISTGVQHVPFPNLSVAKVTNLTKLLCYAIVQDGMDTLPLESNHVHLEGLIPQIPYISDTVQLLRQPLE